MKWLKKLQCRLFGHMPTEEKQSRPGMPGLYMDVYCPRCEHIYYLYPVTFEQQNSIIKLDNRFSQ